MSKAKIILLNGVGSVGKTSIAKELQSILDELYLHIGVDSFIDMMPAKLMDNPRGVSFDFMQKEPYPIVKVNIGDIGKKIFNSMRHAMVTLANLGNNLIVDEVLICDDEMEKCVKLFSDFDVFYVGIHAPLDVIENREKQRKDRVQGLARWQFEVVHHNVTYDLEIDNTSLSPFDCAKLIKIKFHLK